MKENKITWSAISIRQFNAAIDYIAQDSMQNAENVHDTILEKLEQIAKHPLSCPTDKYKLNNKGKHRVFSIFHYRISYLVNTTNIEILRVRHTSMKPKYY